MFEELFPEPSKTLLVDEVYKKKIIDYYETSDLSYSKFSFVNDHRSLRKGKKHLFLGTTGTGKTTLVRSLIFQLAKGAKIFWYSSEESFDDMIYMMTKADIPSDICSNIEFRHESEAQSQMDKFNISVIEYLRKEITQTKCEIFVFDNLTTSKFYTGPYDGLVDLFDKLSQMIKELDIPCLIIAHTATGVKDMQAQLFTGDDIKGPKIVANRCEYIYGYQLITYTNDESDDEKKQGIVRILKARIGNVSNNVYKLHYNLLENNYEHDEKIPFEEFKEFYDQRISLFNQNKKSKK